MLFTSRTLSIRLRSLIQQLRSTETRLKADTTVDGATLREFRQALDTVRLTAWTVSELQNAREANKNANAVISFLAAERLRRFRQMIDAFRSDLVHEGGAWPIESVNDLQESVNMLREQIGQVAFRRGA